MSRKILMARTFPGVAAFAVMGTTIAIMRGGRGRARALGRPRLGHRARRVF